jgi:hypothetical protein
MILSRREQDLIVEALEYMSEDMEYRVEQGVDYSDPEDVESIKTENAERAELARRFGA